MNRHKLEEEQLRAILLAIVLVITWQPAFSADSSTAQTFNGEISDSSCAMNVHSLSSSHAEMLKKKTTGTDAASCARYCVKNMGSSFVLVTKKDVYHLADELKAEPFAGQKVVVRGMLDKKTQTIQMESIEREPAKAPR